MYHRAVSLIACSSPWLNTFSTCVTATWIFWPVWKDLPSWGAYKHIESKLAHENYIHLQTPPSHARVSVKSDAVIVEQPLSQVLVLVSTPFSQVTLQRDQSDHCVNAIASEVEEVKASDFKKAKDIIWGLFLETSKSVLLNVKCSCAKRKIDIFH